MECMISFGRRGFNVCLHHSNKFGVVLTSDRTLYNWNYNRGSNEPNTRMPRQDFNSPFEVNNRKRSYPYNYE